MRACPRCGHEILKIERYCEHCGYVSQMPSSLDVYALGILENFRQCVFHKYADFEGRASRSEFWKFMLGYQLIFAAILFICALLSYITPVSGTVGVGLGLTVLLILSIGLVIPGIAAAVRRLHDIGWSGWLVLVMAIPFVGVPALLIMLAWPGQEGANRFGSPTGIRIVTKRMAHEYGLIDATQSTPMIMGLVACLMILWWLVDRLIML